MKIIDVNAGFGFWPIQRFSLNTLSELDAEYDRLKIDEVWISAIESILYPEPDFYDKTLFAALREFPRFRPIKTVNPLLVNWRRSLERAQSQHPLAGIKLFPNYHGYSLENEIVSEVCEVASNLRLPVLIQMRVNDERNQPSFLQVSGVKAHEVATLARRHETTQFIALSAYNGELREFASAGSNLLADISFTDFASPINFVSKVFPAERLVFGTLAAWMHPCAALMKLMHPSVSKELRIQIAAGISGSPLLEKLSS